MASTDGTGESVQTQHRAFAARLHGFNEMKTQMVDL